MEPKPKCEISGQLARIIEVYNDMNQAGQEELANYAEFLKAYPKYGRKMIPFPCVNYAD